jgi:hypothetical protein
MVGTRNPVGRRVVVVRDAIPGVSGRRNRCALSPGSPNQVAEDILVGSVRVCSLVLEHVIGELELRRRGGWARRSARLLLAGCRKFHTTPLQPMDPAKAAGKVRTSVVELALSVRDWITRN